MTAQVTFVDIGLAITIIGGIAITVLSIVALVGWFTLRHDDKIGPLAKAEQDHKIEAFHVRSVLQAKQSEAEIALAEAKVIEAKAKVVEAQAKATELDMQRLDRQLTRGNEILEAS